MLLKNKKITYLLMLVLIVPILLAGANANALEVNYPAIPTPTGTIDLNCLDIGACNPSIAMFIVVFYGASIWAGGIIAFLALLYTGLTYILGGANPGLRTKAKRRFVDVIWGLAILLMVNAILFTINPEILGSLEEPTLLQISDSGTEFTFLGFTGKEIETGTSSTSTFSCTYVSAPSGDTSGFSCIYTNGECVPEGGDACEAGYAEELCGSYNDRDNAEFLCNSVPQQECPADPNAEGGCVPVGGGSCQAGYAADFCSQYNDEPNAELLCNTVSQAACPADTGGGGGGGSGGGGNIATIYDACTTGAECETKYGSNYTCDRTRNVCIGKYEECVYNTDRDADLAVCWELAWGGGSNYDRERPGCGTDYSPNCHTLVDIKQNVRTELDKEFASKPNVADTFFDIVIPRETGQTWNPASEAKNGVNCTPVGLYQLEDKTRMNPGGKCPEGTHKDENYEIETAHAADVYFNRSCRYWAYWAELFDNSSQCP